jgi:hypothetical protein
VGGEDDEVMNDVAVDAVGKVVVAGFTKSTIGISTFGSFKESIDGTNRDAFVMKFSNDGALLWGTYFGGEDDDENYAVAVDPAGDVYAGRAHCQFGRCGHHRRSPNGEQR